LPQNAGFLRFLAKLTNARLSGRVRRSPPESALFDKSGAKFSAPISLHFRPVRTRRCRRVAWRSRQAGQAFHGLTKFFHHGGGRIAVERQGDGRMPGNALRRLGVNADFKLKDDNRADRRDTHVAQLTFRAGRRMAPAEPVVLKPRLLAGLEHLAEDG